MDEHLHHWRIFGENNLACTVKGCDTVSDVDTLLHNVAADAS